MTWRPPAGSPAATLQDVLLSPDARRSLAAPLLAQSGLASRRAAIDQAVAVGCFCGTCSCVRSARVSLRWSEAALPFARRPAYCVPGTPRGGSLGEVSLHVRIRRRVRLVAVITIVVCLFSIATAARTPRGVTIALLSGVTLSCTLAMLEIALNTRFADLVRRLPVAVTMVLRTILYGLALVLIPPTAFALVEGRWPSPAETNGREALLLSFAFAVGINVAVALSRLLGSGILISLLTGRYHRPREEERVVLFLDVKGSTRLAEQLGDKQFHRFLNRVFYDVSDPVAEAGGEIYRYVGDEVIATWTMKRARRQAACLNCVFAIEDALAARRAHYLLEFGAQPQLRGAIHAGALIIGEMGDWKREIVMLGDTMNTTARIEDVCRAKGCDYIASATVLDRIATLPPGVRAQSLGSVELPGKKDRIALFALSRMAPGAAASDVRRRLDLKGPPAGDPVPIAQVHDGIANADRRRPPNEA
jgi:adenylate cyclase